VVACGAVLAFVTGANGFLGQALVRTLRRRGTPVRALVRAGAPAAALERTGAEILRGDALDPAALARGVAGATVVFHLAGVRRATTPEEFERGNVVTTRLLLEACVRVEPAPRFVLAGSLSAAGPSLEGKHEDDPLLPHEPYGESKAAAERLALGHRERLPVAVARPPRIMGPGDRENLLFFRIAARGLVLRFLGPERPLSWIDVDDCARGLVALGDHPRAPGEAFFLASPERTSVVGLQRAIAHALGARAREVPVPPVALSAAARVADLVSDVSGVKLPLNSKLARQVLAPGWTCHVEKARDLLGFAAATPLADSLARAARWYRQAGWI
jgi:nucleoside-diphosphate-sugar epimerase